MKVILLISLIAAVAIAAPSDDRVIKFAGGRIVGGINADPNDMPHQCSIQWVFLTQSQHICGCSIINNRWVLTAAHCITESSSRGRFEIIAGSTDLSIVEASQQRVGVRRNIVHPLYQGGVGPHDIALIELSAPLTFTNSVKAVTLPAANSIPSGSAILSGWGSTSTSIIPSNPNILQKVFIPVLSMDQCRNALPNDAPLDSSNVCTGPLTGGISACSGDSGGPLIQVSGGVTTQIGIVSWGMTPCGRPNSPSVYGRVSHYIDWIKTNTA